MLRRQPELTDVPFALALPEKSRKVVKAVNAKAQAKGILADMVVADCKAIVPELEVFDYNPKQPEILLNSIAEWFIRYAPYVSVNLPDGLILDVSGCTHLWGGEEPYLNDIQQRLAGLGYSSRIAIADTIGAAWAVSRFGSIISIVETNKQTNSLSSLPPAALRLDTSISEKLQKLGLNTIGSFMTIPRAALRRRFGQQLLTQLDRALGYEMEIMEPVRPVAPYQERLPSLEPIRTAIGIEIALKSLLDSLCERLNRESKGLRKCELRCYRLDGNIQKIEISTNRPSRNIGHLFKLFESRIAQIEPDLGIELFVLEAGVVEELQSTQDALWAIAGANEVAVAELLDRIAGKTGAGSLHRYLPEEHYWPEQSIKSTPSFTEKSAAAWRNDLPRPLHILPNPEQIQVSVPIPDYPPLLFVYKHVIHHVRKADGPERIEQEWWLQSGLYRDYYCVEDEKGARYWLFRLGDYDSGDVKWFIHGFFA